MLFPPSEVLFLVDVLEATDALVGGRELTFGGCGNEPMLTVFRTPLLPGIPEAFSGDRSGADTTGCDVGNADGRDGGFNRDGV